jgi:hypothetical protein
MERIQNFQTFYETTLRPKLAALEADRIQAVGKVKLYGGGGIVLGLVLLFLKLGPIPLILAVITAFVIYYYKAKPFHQRFKHDIIRTMVTAEGLEYDYRSCISRQEYEKSLMYIQSYNRYHGDDYVFGTVGKTAIRFSELTVKYVTQGKNRTEHTIFRGIFFIADFNKHFIGHTVVLPDTSETVFGSFGTFLQGMNFTRPPLVKLEDVEFEKDFVVYGTDQVEARYILSPALMQRILNFKRKVGSRIALSFIGSHVYIGIPITKNLFEAPTLFSSFLQYSQLAEYHGYIQMCVDIVEELDLNTRIWTKE